MRKPDRDRQRVMRSLTRRQLVRRYERYLRSATIMDVWVSDTNGLNNAVGARNNAERWLHAALQELERRGMEPPTAREAWANVPPSEVYVENEGLLENPDKVVMGHGDSLSRAAIQASQVAWAHRRTDLSPEDAVLDRVAEAVSRTNGGWKPRITEIRAMLQEAGL